jgi:hypothetical protein
VQPPGRATRPGLAGWIIPRPYPSSAGTAKPPAQCLWPAKIPPRAIMPPYRAWVGLPAGTMHVRRTTPRLLSLHEADVGGRPLPRWTTARGQTESHDPRTNPASASQKFGESHEREDATEADGDATALLRPLPADRLRIWPVARTVNKVRNDGPELLVPCSVPVGQPVLVYWDALPSGSDPGSARSETWRDGQSWP